MLEILYTHVNLVYVTKQDMIVVNVLQSVWDAVAIQLMVAVHPALAFIRYIISVFSSVYSRNKCL